MKNGLKNLLFIALGFLLGCAASMVIIWFGVRMRSNYLSQANGIQTPTVEAAGARRVDRIRAGW